MFGWFKKKKQYPPFDQLQASALKDQYFLRCAEWDLLAENRICVFDPAGPRVLTLDPWPELVFLAAKGQLTVQEYVYYAADQYDGSIPPLLDQTIVDELQTLLDYRIIRLAGSKQSLDPAYASPRSSRQNNR
jgi:hypothetical protein